MDDGVLNVVSEIVQIIACLVVDGPVVKAVEARCRK